MKMNPVWGIFLKLFYGSIHFKIKTLLIISVNFPKFYIESSVIKIMKSRLTCYLFYNPYIE